MSIGSQDSQGDYGDFGIENVDLYDEEMGEHIGINEDEDAINFPRC